MLEGVICSRVGLVNSWFSLCRALFLLQVHTQVYMSDGSVHTSFIPPPPFRRANVHIVNAASMTMSLLSYIHSQVHTQ